jgi:uncharacterized short protein YbdD (DUF466 family)
MNEKCVCGKSILKFTYEVVRVGIAGEYFGKCCPTVEPKKGQVLPEPIATEVTNTPSTSSQEPTAPIPKNLSSVEKWFQETGLEPRDRNVYWVQGHLAFMNYVDWLRIHCPDEFPMTFNKFGRIMGTLCRKRRFGSGIRYLFRKEL